VVKQLPAPFAAVFIARKESTALRSRLPLAGARPFELFVKRERPQYGKSPGSLPLISLSNLPSQDDPQLLSRWSNSRGAVGTGAV
jgi:hypothetical protein